jgi:hypothetical protein
MLCKLTHLDVSKELDVRSDTDFEDCGINAREDDGMKRG